LIDVRNQLDRYAAPDTVDWHFANIQNRWTKRALAEAGFGYPTPSINLDSGRVTWKPIFSVAAIGGHDSAARAAEADLIQRQKSLGSRDIETGNASGSDEQSIEKGIAASKAYKASGRSAVVSGINRPLFHVDLTIALQSAIANVESKTH
jgi:solute carrier family 26 (sodium-independent sulfate anion transporter), member 11